MFLTVLLSLLDKKNVLFYPLQRPSLPMIPKTQWESCLWQVQFPEFFLTFSEPKRGGPLSTGHWSLRNETLYEGGCSKRKLKKYMITTHCTVWFMYSQKRTCAASFPIPTFMYLWAIYIFPGLVCLFVCSKIGRLIHGNIYITHRYKNVESRRQNIMIQFWK
jgi:hypothetical protein